MFDFLIELLSEESQKYKANSDAYKLETKKYEAIAPKGFPNSLNKVNFNLAYAIRAITINEKISPGNEMYLNGNDKDAARYIWTAIMIVGSVIPSRFDPNSVINLVCGFKTAEEKGFMWGFGFRSLYETEFKKYANKDEIKRFLSNSITKIAEELIVEDKPAVPEPNKPSTQAKELPNANGWLNDFFSKPTSSSKTQTTNPKSQQNSDPGFTKINEEMRRNEEIRKMEEDAALRREQEKRAREAQLAREAKLARDAEKKRLENGSRGKKRSS